MSCPASANARIERLAGHLIGASVPPAAGLGSAETAGKQPASSGSVGSQNLRWYGWGYNDTEFALNAKGLVSLTGSRYLFSGKTLPSLRTWMETKVGLDISNFTPVQKQQPPVPAPIVNEAFLSEIKGHYKAIQTGDADRLFHSHGHTAQELMALRYGKLDRVADAVVYPGSHQHVEVIVKAAAKHNVVLIPFGGGTSVSHALLCPSNEKRMIVSLDMKEMKAVKWVNHKSMLACIEAGAVGKELEEKLNTYGVCMGHEPDSFEFSSLGGWVATRASGMKKNRYGNIEDIVVHVKMVTPQGTLEKGCMVPRISTGPDVHQIIMGSEGIFGVVTEVVVRLRPLPKVRKYGSIVFPDFESGVSCLHEVAIKRCQPASIRLVDNTQFQFGQALKPEVESFKQHAIDQVKKWYVLKHRGFDPERMVAATLLFEGTAHEVREQERQIYEIASLYGGMKAGEENGIRGYFLTYMIAYLRDFGFNYCFMSESFETSVPWENVLPLCLKVKECIRQKAKELGVMGTPLVSCRVTQVYDTGACVYFYLGFLWKGLKDPLDTFSRIEASARDEILKNGGSLSHHHGVGKLRKKWMKDTVGDTGIELLKGVKKQLDPQNIFGSRNLVDPDGVEKDPLYHH